MSKISAIIYFVYIGLCVATGIYSFWAGNKTKFRGANDDDVPMLLIGLFFIIVLQIFSGFLGYTVSKLIRKIRGPPRRNPQALVLTTSSLRDEPRYWSKIEIKDYSKDIQNNQQCPICIDEFPLG